MSDQRSGIDFTEVRTAAQGPLYPVNMVAFDTNGNKFKYVRAASNALTVNLLYVYNGQTGDAGAGTTGTLVASGTAFPCGTPVATVASGGFGWIQVAGRMTLTAAGPVAANARVYTTATAGQLDDASASQGQILGLTAYTAIAGSGTGTFFSPVDLLAQQ